MAAAILVPDDRTVYRGLRNRNWSKGGQVTWKAFMLRPATPEFPIEEELSLGLTPESAVDELQENFGTAMLMVAEIHALPHGLTVRQNPVNEQKADLFGLPLHSVEPEQIDAAISMATDLADISEFLPPIPAQVNG
jgi:hypothetical protein